MIKKLRIKFVIASMVSLFVVLMVIMGAASILNYQEVITNADDILSILKANDGTFPDMSTPSGDRHFSDNIPKKDHLTSPELPYESRYFSVFLSSEKNVIAVNTVKIAAIDTSTAITYAETALNSGRSQGFINDYRYVSYTVDTEIHIIFLDCGRSLGAFRSYVLTGTGVAAAGLLAVFLLMIFLSGRIVKPFLENYQKQKQFITDAGHELKTPLTIIDADTEILEMDFGTNEWLSDIQTQTKRLAQLTNSLILLSRMEEERPDFQMIDFPVSDVVEETAETFISLIKTQEKKLSMKIQPMLSMLGDEKAIRHLITILLDNAVKYSPQPGGEISVSLEKQGGFIRLCVYNTTDHISKEHLEHLFDRFYRTDKSRNSQTGGYGLGLSIASAIVKAHKGKITAATEDEKSLLITTAFPA